MSYLKNELSYRNKYWISKERRLELVHFCLQYEERKKVERVLSGYSSDVSSHQLMYQFSNQSSVEEKAILLADIRRANKMIEDSAKNSDGYLADYILESVTKGIAFPALKIKYGIACGPEYFYERYRKFFWLLSMAKGV